MDPLRDQEIEELVQRVRAGDQAAWVALTDRYVGLLWSVARAMRLTAEAPASQVEPAVVPDDLAIEPVAAVEARDELEAEAAAAVAETESAASAAPEALAEVPAGAVRGDGAADCPDDYPVKGNASSMLYHSPGSPSYKRTVPEFCFASAEAAEAAGFKPTKYEAAHDEGE